MIVLFITNNNALASNDLPIAYYYINDWQVKNDLGQTTISDIGLDGSGHLIVSSGLGLKVFDGESFREKFSYSSVVERNGISKMQIADDGLIWGVNQFGLFQFSDKALNSHSIPIKYNIYNSLELYAGKVPWVISDFKLLEFNEKKFKEINNSILATAIAKSHNENFMWIGTKGGLVKVDREGNIKEQKKFNNENILVLSILESIDGTIWVNTSHGVFLIKDDIKKFGQLDSHILIRKFYQDSQQNIWMLTNSGVYLYQNHVLKEVNVEDNRELRARGMIEDSLGNMWFVTWAKGLYRLKTSDFDVIRNDINPTSYMQTQDGTQWIGSYKGLFIESEGKSTLVNAHNIKTKLVYDTEEGLDGTVWVAYLNDLVKFESNGSQHKIVTEIDAMVYRFLLKDQNNRLWVGTNKGLFYKDLELKTPFQEFKFPSDERIKTVLQVNNGELLLITNSAVYIYADNKLSKNALTRLIVPNNYTVSYDEKTKTVWYYNPKQHKIIQYHQNQVHEYYLPKLLKFFSIYNVVADANDDLIVLGERGVLRIRKAWMEEYQKNDDNKDNKFVLYEVLAIPGNENFECNSGHRSIVTNTKGNLVLTCKDVLLELKKKLTSSLLNIKPIVEIHGIEYEGELLGFIDGRHEFSSDTSSYSFDLISNSLNEIYPLTIRYKLHGLDKEWRDYDSDTSVTYVTLRPGNYTFEVQVKNTSNSWQVTENGIMDFKVDKYYYQEINFIALTILMALVLVTILFVIYDYLRNKRLILEAKILTKLVEEKTESLKNIQQRELEHEKISKEILTQEIKITTKRLTNQMDVILDQEKQIRETQKMEVVGQLTSGIAHDFNNMLSIIFIGSDVIKKNLIIQEKDQNIDQKENLKWLEKVSKTSENCKEVIGQLLHFSRNNTDSKTILSTNKILRDIVSLIKITIPNTLNFSMDLMNEEGLIKEDVAQFNQIILNLIINARDACNDYGEIKVVTSRLTMNDEMSCSSCGELIKGKYIEVQIIDNGKGIAEDIIPSIFKPFFTVKENNLGSGIGLNVVDSNIHNMKGHVVVESKVGIGTTFRVLIPQTSEKLSLKKAVKFTRGTQVNDRTINVLLVEDSASLVDLICLILKDADINVDVAIDGIFGNELFYNNPEKYDLIISDNSMPRLKGLDMAKKILRTHPNTKLVLLTGDVTNDVVEEAKSIGIVEVLHKPIRADDLVGIVFKYVD